jgi:hypothetical protein
MNAATVTKIGVSGAWLLSATAAMMLMFVTDHYRGGYEDMVRDAAAMFVVGLAVAAAASVAAAVVRRRNPEALSGTWLGFTITHIALSALFLAGAFVLARLSTW